MKIPTVDGLVPLTIVAEKNTLLFIELYKIVLDWSRAPDLRLVLDSVEDLVVGEPERREVLYRRKDLE